MRCRPERINEIARVASTMDLKDAESVLEWLTRGTSAMRRLQKHVLSKMDGNDRSRFQSFVDHLERDIVYWRERVNKLRNQ